ncbi:arylesterase [Salicola sp. Rm-C-2C1-2]|uniref:arylesterase n=1 Tax=Salicola sp. Rm-C-2C1-2 TaxID=3141321 RepID=UPI0032E45C52
MTTVDSNRHALRGTHKNNTLHSFSGSFARALIAAFLLALPMLAQGNTLVIYGDSLSAAYGIEEENGWVSLLQERIAKQAPTWQVVNASISGETTDGGLRRIERMLETQSPDLVVLELGGNDGLRGKDPSAIRSNLARMVERIRSEGARVLLVGIEIPPNYGRAYTDAFRSQYRRLAKEKNLTFIPFLLENIHNRQGMMQEDGIHPTAEAQPLIRNRVWDALHPLLEKAD